MNYYLYKDRRAVKFQLSWCSSDLSQAGVAIETLDQLDIVIKKGSVGVTRRAVGDHHEVIFIIIIVFRCSVAMTDHHMARCIVAITHKIYPAIDG